MKLKKIGIGFGPFSLPLSYYIHLTPPPKKMLPPPKKRCSPSKMLPLDRTRLKGPDAEQVICLKMAEEEYVFIHTVTVVGSFGTAE